MLVGNRKYSRIKDRKQWKELNGNRNCRFYAPYRMHAWNFLMHFGRTAAKVYNVCNVYTPSVLLFLCFLMCLDVPASNIHMCMCCQLPLANSHNSIDELTVSGQLQHATNPLKLLLHASPFEHRSTVQPQLGPSFSLAPHLFSCK